MTQFVGSSPREATARVRQAEIRLGREDTSGVWRQAPWVLGLELSWVVGDRVRALVGFEGLTATRARRLLHGAVTAGGHRQQGRTH